MLLLFVSLFILLLVFPSEVITPSPLPTELSVHLLCSSWISLLCFSHLEVATNTLWRSELLSLAMSSLLMSSQGQSSSSWHFFLCVSFSFDSFSSLCLPFPPLLQVSRCLVTALRVLAIVVLNSHSDCSNIPTVSESGFDVPLPHCMVVFSALWYTL